MNQERFEFRAFDETIKKMFFTGTLLIQHDVIMMMSTGLKDVKGQLIFEGDIVKCKTPYGKGVEAIVWDDQRAGFFMTGAIIDAKNLYKLSGKRMEVIGNIYETPHLLKAAS